MKCVSRLSDKKIYGYGNDKPLNIAGCVNANVSVNDKCVQADFFVVEEKGQALLGKQTALDLGILQIPRAERCNVICFLYSSTSIHFTTVLILMYYFSVSP